MTVRHIPLALQPTERGAWVARCTCGWEAEERGDQSRDKAEAALFGHLLHTRSLRLGGEQGTEEGEQMRFGEGA